jgi:hypothetical protein
MPPATGFGRHGNINPLAQDIKILYPVLTVIIENIKSGEAPMRQFTIAAATVAMAAFISAAPALADRHDGGPIKQNGQCWKASKASEGLFGYWRACPEPAGNSVAPAAQRTSGRRSQ